MKKIPLLLKIFCAVCDRICRKAVKPCAVSCRLPYGQAEPCPQVCVRGHGKHRAKTKKTGAVKLVRLLQLSAAGEVFLEGTCPLSRGPQTAKFPVPILLGTGRRWVRKATAFRGRSEQDRSALCAACSTMILKTFRWNVFNGVFLS